MKALKFRCEYCNEMFKEIYNLKDGTKCCENCYEAISGDDERDVKE